MSPRVKHWLNLGFGFLLIVLIIWLFYWGLSTVWRALKTVDTNLAVGLITGASTIIVATLTVVVGKYYERKREIEAHFRTAKIEIYDEFLKEFFKLFGGGSEPQSAHDLTEFLREWQRKMVLYGGAQVLLSYLKWKNHLGKGNPDAQTLFLMGEFFLAMRKDVGLSNTGLEKGTFSHLILKHPELFLEIATDNPNVTLEELGAMEKKLGLE